MVFVVHAAAVVVEAVGDDEVVHTKDEVVAGDLLKDVLRDGDVRGFILDNHARCAGAVVEYAVATFGSTVEGERDLVGKESLGIAEVVEEEMHEMLAHPFFGSEGDVTASDHVENAGFCAPLNDF